MFYQNDVYVATEYGTRECQEDREPCGAFYGVPFSGEVEDIAEYDRQQMQDAMPSRHFSKRDELVLAHMRGEVELPTWVLMGKHSEDELKAEPTRKPQINEPNKDRVRKLVMEFAQNTHAPRDIILKYEEIATTYANGEWRLLNELLNMYSEWMKNRRITLGLIGTRT